MNLKCRLRNIMVHFGLYRIIGVVGVASKIRNSDKHYLLFDCDSGDCDDFKPWFLARFGGRVPCFVVDTNHGCHGIAFDAHSFESCVSILGAAPQIDKTWVAIGMKRGYWFLESKYDIRTLIPLMPNDVTFMRIERVAT